VAETVAVRAVEVTEAVMAAADSGEATVEAG
jgi:hypothetical protein